MRLSGSNASDADDPTLAAFLVRVEPDADPGGTTHPSFVRSDTALRSATAERAIDCYDPGSVIVDRSTETTGGDGPGLGPVATLVALVAVAAALAARTR